MSSTNSPRFRSELWAKKERLVYKPKSRFLKAHLRFDIRKLDDQTAQVTATGELRLPFQPARQIEWSGQLSSGEPRHGDTPEVFLLPVLLRSFFHERNSGEFSFQIGGRPFMLRLSIDARTTNSYRAEVAKIRRDVIEWDQARSAKLSWNADKGVMSAIEFEAPIVGRVVVELEACESEP